MKVFLIVFLFVFVVVGMVCLQVSELEIEKIEVEILFVEIVEVDISEFNFGLFMDFNLISMIIFNDGFNLLLFNMLIMSFDEFNFGMELFIVDVFVDILEISVGVGEE